MSRCAFPTLTCKLAIPSPKLVLPKLPLTLKIGMRRIPNLPGCPNLGFKLCVPSPKLLVPKLPITIKIGMRNFNLRGLPSLGFKPAVPKPKVIVPKLPTLATMPCPLDKPKK
jgi:hypothetical protein